ncbi:MAG TPA: SRPBCC family protein [Rhizomicrobium sp.]|nr:SRPBCC family protein [Rhizomicrobium sp.]
MKKILMASTLLVLGVTQVQAQTPQPADWVTLTLTADIAKPADVAWERVGGNDWCAIAKYLEVKGCTINSGKGELGSVRTIITATANLVENVVARTSRSYTYAQPFSPIFYHGTMAIEPVDAGHSRLVYSFIWNQAGLPDQKARTDAYEGRKVRFQAAMDKMKAAAEAP